jgi:hypothetical protein
MPLPDASGDAAGTGRSAASDTATDADADAATATATETDAATGAGTDTATDTGTDTGTDTDTDSDAENNEDTGKSKVSDVVVVLPPKDSDKDGSPDNKDCAPFDKAVHPGAKEVCNGKDDDCDKAVDEGVKNACGKCGLVPKEVCNDKDDDCDGKTDEAVCPTSAAKVCYPGATNAYNVCFNLTPKSQVKLAGYTWAAHANPQYKSPSNLLDLNAAPASSKVAANFTLGELMQKSKGKYGIYSAKTVSRLQSVRTSLGVAVTINSGFRSPGYNAGISGAAKFSRHQYGDAADMTTKGKTTLAKIISTCKAKGASYTQLYTSHVHCDWRNDTLGHDFWPKTGTKSAGSKWGGPPPGAGGGAGGEQQIPGNWAQVTAFVVPLKGRRVVRFIAKWGPAFDEGTPWRTWLIETPAGQLQVENQSVVDVPVTRPGLYRAELMVGAAAGARLTVRVDR